MKITFYGAVGGVTGSKYLVEHAATKILVDCGLFQGNREITQHNLDPLPIKPEEIDALVLTHAHIDHTGYIPALVKQGFRGPIYCSQATYKTCAILLPDSGNLQESEAKKEHAEQPLYTKLDAEYALTFFKPIAYDTPLIITSLTITLVRSGHILGSAFVIVHDGTETLTFSGDLGRPQQPLLKAPPYLNKTDYLVLESTYGDRVHPDEDPQDALRAIITQTARHNGKILIPSFSVMRTQLILYYLYQLQQAKAIPHIPIFLDSPTGIAVTNLFCSFQDEYIIPPATCNAAFSIATQTPLKKDSKELDHLKGSAIIIAGSGMAEGGRIPFHLRRYIGDARNTVVFVGYQAQYTTGRYLVDGAHTILIDDQEYPVRAAIKTIPSLSAHADVNEIIAWLGHFAPAPKKLFLTHGDTDALQALKKAISERFSLDVVIPNYGESYTL